MRRRPRSASSVRSNAYYMVPPGNPTRSYRTREPLRVVAEILDWEPHSPEVLQDMRNHLERLNRLGIEAIND